VILYLDTSALVKLYIEEAGSGDVASSVSKAGVVVTARVTYAEARATFARLAREGVIAPAGHRGVVRALDEDWSTYSIIDVSEVVVRRAGALAERHSLRGYDAVQLAAALDVRLVGGADVSFASFDSRLNQAARRERLTLGFV
jgi:predicted nucleic acid-binding protein